MANHEKNSAAAKGTPLKQDNLSEPLEGDSKISSILEILKFAPHLTQQKSFLFVCEYLNEIQNSIG